MKSFLLGFGAALLILGLLCTGIFTIARGSMTSKVAGVVVGILVALLGVRLIHRSGKGWSGFFEALIDALFQSF